MDKNDDSRPGPSAGSRVYSPPPIIIGGIISVNALQGRELVQTHSKAPGTFTPSAAQPGFVSSGRDGRQPRPRSRASVLPLKLTPRTSASAGTNCRTPSYRQAKWQQALLSQLSGHRGCHPLCLSGALPGTGTLLGWMPCSARTQQMRTKEVPVASFFWGLNLKPQPPGSLLTPSILGGDVSPSLPPPYPYRICISKNNSNSRRERNRRAMAWANVPFFGGVVP